VAKAEPPPPPPPPKPKAAPPKPKVEAAPVVAAPAALVAPKEVPLEKPPEADAAHAVAAAPMAVGGIGRPVAGAVIAGPGAGEVTTTLGTTRAPPINLPENATPPQPLASNLMPEYPPEARTQGREGLVILKGVVEVDGRVTHLQVMKGEEPFASAALQAVRTWRFEPALVAGPRAAVYRIFKVPFRLRA
jgi:protein TonB